MECQNGRPECESSFITIKNDMKKKYKFNKKADAALAKFYKKTKANTAIDKRTALDRFFGGESNYSHHPTVEQKVAMMEYEWLHHCGLIEYVSV